ncbi:MAG: glycosyltransferase family 1 protein [Acidobacteria bacterium]|jgi:glycosyltransferase involved in cell wall biosynthesis|nr:glycosyltransferase family 1 protein [Acidobacteriota bacterium]
MAVEPRADRPGARVLVLAFSDLARDPRVHRQLRFLAPLHQVTAAGWADPQIDGVRFVPLAPRPKPLPRKLLAAVRLLAGRFDAYTWNRSEVLDCRTRLAGIEADVVVANDIDALPVALALFPGARVLFDAHEYAPLEFEDRLFFRVFQQRLRAWQCRTFIPRAAAMTTVCESIAEAYERDTGMRAEIVLNAPDYEPLPPTDTSARGGPPGSIRLVHHGAAIRSRRIEAMIRTLRLLDPRFTLDLYLTGGDTAYFDELRREAGGDERVRFNDPVPMRELPRVLNAYDVGLFLLEPTNFNYRFALPNKLFEFVQARLAVAIGPSPEMARVVRGHQLGIVADDFRPETMANALGALDAGAVMRFKRAADAAARALSADAARETITRIVGRLAAESR